MSNDGRTRENVYQDAACRIVVASEKFEYGAHLVHSHDAVQHVRDVASVMFTPLVGAVCQSLRIQTHLCVYLVTVM